MKILVTGGLGFQGTNLSKALLERDHHVWVLNTPSADAHKNLAWLKENTNTKNLNVIWGTIENKDLFERIVPIVDVVFHLAARVNVDESIESPDAFFNTNIMGTYNVLNYVVKHKKRIIMASTCEVYGGGKDLDESSNLYPKSPYGASKASADRIAYAYNQTYGIQVDIVRPFNVYGPLQKEGGRGAVIAIFFKKILDNQQISIHGDGKQGRDFIFIDDVVRGYLGILHSPNYNECRVFTFGTGVSTSVNEIVQHISEIVGKPLNTTNTPNRLGQIDYFIAKKNVQDYFGGAPMISIRKGLEKYYKFRFQDMS
jgi:dTDP-glucose 4,6-dehydratase